MKRSSKSRLTCRQAEEFIGSGLFEKIARAVCRAGTLPAKELFETWETARRVRRRFRGGRIIDCAGGHGLLAHIMLILDDSSAEAVVVDKKIPANAQILSSIMIDEWPRLKQRIKYSETAIEDFTFDADDVVVAIHACGILTDIVLHKAADAKSRIAVLPCCQNIKTCDTGGLEGWVAGDQAVDLTRAAFLRDQEYDIHTALIPEDITPQNRLLMGMPR